MGRTVWHITMSLDGFIAGPDDSMQWAFDAFEHYGPAGMGDEIMRSTGAIFAGRHWYDVAAARYDGVAGIYGGAWTGPVFVLTHRPDEAPDDPAVTFLSGDPRDALERAHAAAGGKNVELFGASIAQQCLQSGLVDEIAVHLAPVLLGDGTRLYGGPGAGRVDLQRTYTSECGQVVDLRFDVAPSSAADSPATG
jgi:dihydrofolate reductase